MLRSILFIIIIFATELDNYIQQFCYKNKINTIYSVFKLNEEKRPEFLAKGIANGFNDSYHFENQHNFIFSCTKQMTSILILQLIERGNIQLHTTVAEALGKNCPYWHKDTVPSWAHQVTIYQLLTHTSNLSDYVYDPFFIAKKKLDSTEYKKSVIRSCGRLYKILSKDNNHSYVNSNFFILSIILEQHYNDSLSNIFRTQIFQPMGMTNSFLLEMHENHELLYYDIPNSYIFKPINTQNNFFTRFLTKKFFIENIEDFKFAQFNILLSLQNRNRINKTMMFGDGGVISTLNDMITFLSHLHYNKTILSEESYNLIFTPHEVAMSSLYKSKYDKFFYGLGTQIIQYQDISALGHAGNFGGYRFEGVYIPEKEIFIVLFGNQGIMPRYEKDIGFYMHLENRQYDIKYLLENLITNHQTIL